jgi:MarR family transcriptional regulator, lower aerobic nicotinate degradation pathway regulator
MPNLVSERPPRVSSGDPTARVMDALRRFVRALRAADRVTEREFGVSVGQLFVLQQLAEEPRQSLQRLADRTLTATSSASEVVTRLVNAGLVSRSRSLEDGRRVILEVTASGHGVLARAPRPVHLRMIDGLRQLSDEERRVLADIMDIWLVQAGLASIPATILFDAPEE